MALEALQVLIPDDQPAHASVRKMPSPPPPPPAGLRESGSSTSFGEPRQRARNQPGRMRHGGRRTSSVPSTPSLSPLSLHSPIVKKATQPAAGQSRVYACFVRAKELAPTQPAAATPTERAVAIAKAAATPPTGALPRATGNGVLRTRPHVLGGRPAPPPRPLNPLNPRPLRRATPSAQNIAR